MTKLSSGEYARLNSNKFSGLETSPEVLDAIETVSGELLDPHDDSCLAYRVWAEPSQAQITEVERLAWGNADDDQDVLHWGCESLNRPK